MLALSLVGGYDACGVAGIGRVILPRGRELTRTEAPNLGRILGRQWAYPDACNATSADALILSEVRTSNLSALSAELAAGDFNVCCSAGSPSPYEVLVAVHREFDIIEPRVQPVERTQTVVLNLDGGQVLLVGVYAPSNGFTSQSSARRASWQTAFLDWVGQEHGHRDRWILAGDLNVLEPGHQPPNEFYEGAPSACSHATMTSLQSLLESATTTPCLPSFVTGWLTVLGVHLTWRVQQVL